MSSLITIVPDNSSLQDKINSIQTLQYCKRNWWETPARKGVLTTNDNYQQLILIRKKELESERQCVYNPRSNKTINSKIYKTVPSSNILFSSVVSCSGNENLESYTEDSFVSTYALLTNNITPITATGGRNVLALDFIQLSRYDPRETITHQNDLSSIPPNELTAYLHYFGLQSPTPHMHFACLDNAINYNDSTKLAINLFKLLEYIMDLMQDKPLSTITNFNMPYLMIKNNPKLYKTKLYDSNIVDCLNLSKGLSSQDAVDNIKNTLNTTKTKQSQKMFDNMLNSCDDDGVELFGLEAVFMDLWTLACKHYSNNQDLSDELALALKIISGGSNEGYQNIKETTYGL